MGNKTYVVLEQISRGEKVEHRVDDEINLDSSDAKTKRLLSLGAIARPEDLAPKRKAPTGDSDEQLKAAEAKAEEEAKRATEAEGKAKELEEQLAKAQEAEKAAEAKVAELEKALEDAKKAGSGSTGKASK